jgi:hypothetical protein
MVEVLMAQNKKFFRYLLMRTADIGMLIDTVDSNRVYYEPIFVFWNKFEIDDNQF